MTPRSTSHRVDGPALWRLLDAQRRARGLSWRAVAREAGTSTGSLFTRLQRDDVSLHGDALVSLLVWLRLDADLQEIIRPTGAAPVPAETVGPVALALAHALRTSTVSELQQAFRQAGMAISFAIADDEEPTQ
jgi:hypothetical protein